MSKTGSSRILHNTELVEVFVEGGSTRTKIKLPDVPNLRRTEIIGCSFYTFETVENSVISGEQVAAISESRNVSLTLQNYAGKNFMLQKPVLSFNTMTTLLGEGFPIKFNRQKVNYPKSYIEFSRVIDIPAEDRIYLFEFYYLEPPGEAKSDSEATFRKRK